MNDEIVKKYEVVLINAINESLKLKWDQVMSVLSAEEIQALQEEYDEELSLCMNVIQSEIESAEETLNDLLEHKMLDADVIWDNTEEDIDEIFFSQIHDPDLEKEFEEDDDFAIKFEEDGEKMKWEETLEELVEK